MKIEHQKAPVRLAAAVILVATLGVTAFAAISVPRPTDAFYVNDFAGILSPETERYIAEKSRAYDLSDGTQLVVATIPSLEGSSIEDYSLTLAREWGIGSANKDNGLLVLLSVADRELRIEVGYGLEGIFNDGKTGRFRREYANPYLKEDRWDEGILSLYNALLGELANPTPLDQEEGESGSLPGALVIVFLVIIVFGFLNRGAGGTGGTGGGRFVRFPRTFYGGGGFGGSSGGRGGGFGGGGGFHGGGGGFGGGGSSGKF